MGKEDAYKEPRELTPDELENMGLTNDEGEKPAIEIPATAPTSKEMEKIIKDATNLEIEEGIRSGEISADSPEKAI